MMERMQILMGVYEGQDYLPTQLQSIADQSFGDWHLLVSDDSHSPASKAYIHRFAAQSAQTVQILTGPQNGFAANYLHLLHHATPGPLAFADQDDLWLPEKLARAQAALDRIPAHQPALYCARVWPWDGTQNAAQNPHLRPPPLAPLRRPPGFRNALIENIAMGNTIVLNPRAAAIAREMAQTTQMVFAHDWWLYLLITGIGGTVIRDDAAPVLLYRQHPKNAIGSGQGIGAQMRRKRAVLQGAFAQRLALNIAALGHARHLLTAENATLLDRFVAAQRSAFPARLTALRQLGLYRQTSLGTAGFFGAAALGLT